MERSQGVPQTNAFALAGRLCNRNMLPCHSGNLCSETYAIAVERA